MHGQEYSTDKKKNPVKQTLPVLKKSVMV